MTLLNTAIQLVGFHAKAIYHLYIFFSCFSAMNTYFSLIGSVTNNLSSVSTIIGDQQDCRLAVHMNNHLVGFLV